MNKVIVIVVLLTFFSAGFSKLSYGQITQSKLTQDVKNILTSEQWEEDLDSLVCRLEIIHPDLYANVSKERFDNFVKELHIKSRTESDVNMYIGIMELVKLVKDGHTWVSWGEGKIARYLHLPPLTVYMFSDGLYITSAIKKYNDVVGKKIVKICNFPTEEFIERLSRIKSGENKWGEITIINLFIEELCYLNIMGSNDSFKLTLEDEAGIRTEVEIEPVPLKNYFPHVYNKAFPLKDSSNTTMNGNCSFPLPLWLSRLDSSGFGGDRYWFTFLPEQEALYVQINQCKNKDDEPFDKFYKRMFKALDEKKAKCLIIDVRNNIGGDHYEQPLLLGIIERPYINKTDKLFLITSRFTFSSAQHLVNQLTRYTNSTVFGEPTGAKPNFFGGQQGFYLPNSRLYVAVSTKLWQDVGPNDFRISTEPDFYIPLTSADYRNNHDPVLEKIFNYNSYKSMRLEFTEKIKKIYKVDGIEGLKKVFPEIKPDYEKYGFNMENLLYHDLDSWMANNAKSNEEYINFLRFLHKELPNSVDVCWDLASWTENIEEKINLYKECLEINPAHKLARMRLNLIKLGKQQN